MNVKNLNVRDKFKRIGALLGTSFVLMGTLAGCGKYEKGDSYRINNNGLNSYYSDMVDNDINDLPSDLESFSLSYCNFITDLSSLPKVCPNIKRLSLINCSSITDLSFIYSLHNLEYVYLNDMVGVSKELIKYLDDNGIEYDISDRDLISSEKAKKIIDEIITDDMTDEERIRAVALYVYENCKYKSSYCGESNSDPLETTLIDKIGVCAGYAYTTNVLLRMAGISSYEVFDDDHAWNLINLDGKYYYLDDTNLHGCLTKKSVIFLMKKYGISMGNYLSDPTATMFTGMSDYDEILIPDGIVEDIMSGQDEKTIVEKYKNSVSTRFIELILSIVGITLAIKLTCKIKDEISYRF